jgi:hypothetical protein
MFVTNGAAAGGDRTTVVTAIDIAAMTMRGLAIIDDPMATMAGMRMVVVAGITVGTTTTTDDIDEVLALSIMRQLKFTGALLGRPLAETPEALSSALALASCLGQQSLTQPIRVRAVRRCEGDRMRLPRGPGTSPSNPSAIS